MKGGMFFKDNPYKTCENNKRDWEKWKLKPEYALYDSSYLYPGGMNWRGAVPTKNRLLDESDSPRKCLEPVKSCEQNKKDWQEYWYPEYSHYIPHMLYSSDKNLKPIPNRMICTDADFAIYGESAEYREFMNRPENLKFQLEQLDTLKYERQPNPPVVSLPASKPAPSITPEVMVVKEKYKELRKMRYIQSQFEKELNKIKNPQLVLTPEFPVNKKILFKLILTCLLLCIIKGKISRDDDVKAITQLEQFYKSKTGNSLPGSNKQYIDAMASAIDVNDFISELGIAYYIQKLQDLTYSPLQSVLGNLDITSIELNQLKKALSAENYKKLLNYLFSQDKNELDCLPLKDIEEYLTPLEFNELLKQFHKDSIQRQLTSAATKLETQKAARVKTRETRKLFSLEENDELEVQDSQQEISAIIVAHNTRLQCFLDAIHQNENEDKIRFMNCAILKLTITPQSLHLSMVYQGDLSETEKRKINADRPYYVKDPASLPGHIVYPPAMYPLDNVKDFLKLPLIDKQYTFYIVRHGQSQHNDSSNVLANTMHAITDTSLTEEGIIQAKIAGRQLYEYITLMQEPIPSYLFVSDLVRTHETLFEIIDNMRQNPESPVLVPYSKPIVLPCASELPIKGTRGNCDQITGDSSLYNKLASENYSKCSINPDGSLHPKCNVNVDWNTLYLPFYGGLVRGQKDTATGYIETRRNPLNKHNCRDTNMVALAIKHIAKVVTGGKRKTKKYKRRKTKKNYSLHSL